MRGPRSSVFLERQTYRRRRLIDWIKILPLIGLVLWLVPLLWPVEGEARVSSAGAIIYLFAVWFVLVVGKAVSARALRDAGDMDPIDRSRSDHG